MLKGKRGVSACSLISCRIRAEALARAFNTRLWPCAWVTQRSPAERDDGMSNGIEDDEEFFDASPSPVEVEDESLFCKQHSSAATEAGRAKLYELLQQHATDDAIDVFYDVSEDAGLSDTCLKNGLKEPVQVDNFCQSSEYCRLTAEPNILNDNLDDNVDAEKNSDIELPKVGDASSSLKHETLCDSQINPDPSISCCSSSGSSQEHELDPGEICDENLSNESKVNLFNNSGSCQNGGENSLMAKHSESSTDLTEDEILQNGEIIEKLTEQSDFEPSACNNEAKNLANKENSLNSEISDSCSTPESSSLKYETLCDIEPKQSYDKNQEISQINPDPSISYCSSSGSCQKHEVDPGEISDENLSNASKINLFNNSDSCENGEEKCLMAKHSESSADLIEDEILQNGEIIEKLTEQSDFKPSACNNEAENLSDKEDSLNSEISDSCTTESKIDDKSLDITDDNPVFIAVIETNSPSPTSESPVIKNAPLRYRLQVFDESRPKISRTTSLKTGKTPPGTPTRKKIVRFADVLGLDLEDVHHIMSGDVPIIPSSAYTDLDLKDTDLPTTQPISETVEVKTRQPACWKTLHGATATNVLYPMFTIPGEQPDFLEKVRFQGICLETVVVSDMSVQCTCRVMNYGFHKKVTVRYSVNDWLSSNDIDGLFVQGSSNGETDNFAFSIFLSPMNRNMKFALKYTVNGNEYWDNNKGQNYCFNYHGNDNIQHVSSSLWQHQFW